MIKVYQIQLTDNEIDTINSDGEYTPRIKAFFDRSFERTFKAENFKYYDHVATVDTDSMEDAFTLMNLWEDPYKVSKIPTRRCSSMSVGDILEMEDGTLYRCASFGFTKLENVEYA
ncbi:MAG: hypothetical protein ACO4AM_07575 [Candidatus Nanopelagicaceae bacterium]